MPSPTRGTAPWKVKRTTSFRLSWLLCWRSSSWRKYYEKNNCFRVRDTRRRHGSAGEVAVLLLQRRHGGGHLARVSFPFVTRKPEPLNSASKLDCLMKYTFTSCLYSSVK